MDENAFLSGFGTRLRFLARGRKTTVRVFLWVDVGQTESDYVFWCDGYIVCDVFSRDIFVLEI